MATTITIRIPPLVCSTCSSCPKILISMAFIITLVASAAMTWSTSLWDTLIRCGSILDLHVERSMHAYSFFLIFAILVLLIYGIRKYCFDRPLNKLLFIASVSTAIAIFIMTGVAITSLICGQLSGLALLGCILTIVSCSMVLISAILILRKKLPCCKQCCTSTCCDKGTQPLSIRTQSSISRAPLCTQQHSCYYITPNEAPNRPRPSVVSLQRPSIELPSIPKTTYTHDNNDPHQEYYMNPDQSHNNEDNIYEEIGSS